ncbi:MAG: hypothetical protein AB7N65_27700, partial [Vicinamibacterales bacterium]
MRTIVEMRGLAAMTLATAAGAWGLTGYPIPRDNVFLQIIALRDPLVFRGIAYAYAVLWFSTPFLLASVLLSFLTISVYRRPQRTRLHALPPYPKPETRPSPSLVLGESHFLAQPGRAPDPEWLEIP